MNVESIAGGLESWMKVDTWHTTHPLDEKRFHHALAVVFEENGYSITYDDFRSALLYLAAKLPSVKLVQEHLEQRIDDLAQKAEIIAGYLSDNSG